MEMLPCSATALAVAVTEVEVVKVLTLIYVESFALSSHEN